VVLRLLRGEPTDALSREVSMPIYKLERWRARALAGIDAGLKERESDSVVAQLDDANRRIGELVMEIEILALDARFSQSGTMSPTRGETVLDSAAPVQYRILWWNCCLRAQHSWDSVAHATTRYTQPTPGRSARQAAHKLSEPNRGQS
jgi:hypothetical protein